MRIIVATSVGQSADGEFYDLFPSGWTTKGAFKSNTYFPHDLALLAAMLEELAQRDPELGLEVRMIDGNYQGYPVGEYTEVLVAAAPDVVVMESDVLTFPEDSELLRRVKARTGARVVACGPYPTADPGSTLAAGADFVALGEFEETVVALVASGFDPTTQGVFPNARRPLGDFSAAPLPNPAGIERRSYCRIYACEYRELEVQATRGCPFDCDFCAARHLYSGSSNYRMRDPDAVAAEIAQLAARWPEMEGVFFSDRSHTINRRYSHALCEALRRAGLEHLRYECLTNYASLDRDLVRDMRRAGYYKVRLGVETLDEDMAGGRFTCRKGKSDNERLFEVLRLCRDEGMKVYASVSVGTYGSTEESDAATLAGLKRLCESDLVQEFQVSICTPMPGTPFYDKLQAEGLIASAELGEYNGIRDCVIDYPEYPRAAIVESFRKFHGYLMERVRENRRNGVNYSMYDADWVAEVLAVTPRAATYRK